MFIFQFFHFEILECGCNQVSGLIHSKRDKGGDYVVSKKAEKLYDRACLWETRSKQAALKGDYDRAGKFRTKSMQLMTEARRIEEKG